MEKKIIIFSILMTIVTVITTGVNFLAYKEPAMGIAFIVVTIGLIITLFCYSIETRKVNK